MNEITIKIDGRGVVRLEDVTESVEKAVHEHNKEGYQAIEDLIDISLRTKTLITLVKNQYRGFGKSKLLERKAEELGAVLVVPRELKRFYVSFDSNPDIKCYVSPQQVRGVRLKSGFIVDEGVDSEVIKELSRNNEFLGGFNRL